jgi:hypothetical protein
MGMIEKIPVPTPGSTQPVQKAASGASLSPPAYGISFIDNQVAQRQENKTGMSDQLKSGVESLSGLSMNDVKVHYNSPKPAQLQAHAYAQGNQIHLGPGQEKHLPHEAWHVVQQKQGRVQPTIQMKEAVPVNDDAGLEHEADVMGAKAQQVPGHNRVELTNRHLVSTTYQGKFKVAGVEYTEYTTQIDTQLTKEFESSDWAIEEEQIDEIKEEIKNMANRSKIVTTQTNWLNLIKNVAGILSIPLKTVDVSEKKNFNTNKEELETIKTNLKETIGAANEGEKNDEKEQLNGINTFLKVLAGKEGEIKTAMIDCLRSTGELLVAIKVLKTFHKVDYINKTYDAVCTHAGIESTDKRSRGFAKLKITGGQNKTITGRPDFPSSTKKAVKIKPREHRRHIIAWHSIREFMTIEYQRNDKLAELISKRLEETMESNEAVKEGVKFASGKKAEEIENYKDELRHLSKIDILKLGLFIMNGNPKNLWSGSGKVNSTINTSSMHIQKQLYAVSSVGELKSLISAWKEVKLTKAKKTNSGRIYLVGIKIACDIGQQCLEDKEIPKDKKIETFKQRVRDWLISNYEIDLLGKDKDQNEMLLKPTEKKSELKSSGSDDENASQHQGKYPSLQETIETVHDVLEGKKTKQDAIDAAIKTLLTYT